MIRYTLPHRKKVINLSETLRSFTVKKDHISLHTQTERHPFKGSRTNVGVDKRRSVKIIIKLSISMQIRLG